MDGDWRASPELVNAAATKLEKLHTEGKLPDDAFASISEVIELARSDEWDDARFAQVVRAGPTSGETFLIRRGVANPPPGALENLTRR